ncbi:hypothetical protein GCM10009736_46350 [Actinomadura bangladeshensis]
MHSNGRKITFAAPRRPWRRIVIALLVVCSVALIVFLAASPDRGSGFWLGMSIVLFCLWPVSLIGTLLACFSWFVQVRQGGAGSVARMDPTGIHIRGGQAIAWPEIESIFTRRATTGDLLLCIRPAETAEFVARAPAERQDGMRANLTAYEAPIFINLSAFWQGSTDDLSARIATLTAGRLSIATGD